MRPGQPDLLRARLTGRLPVHCFVDGFAHAFEPPCCPLDSALAPSGDDLDLCSAQPQFHLLICHNMSFYFYEHILTRGVGQMPSKGKKIFGFGKGRKHEGKQSSKRSFAAPALNA